MASPPAAATAIFVVLCLALYWSRGLYGLRFRIHTLDDLRTIFGATTLAAMLVLTGRVLLGSTADLATETARLWAFTLAYVSAGRLAWYWSQQRARVVGESVRPTLIVGAGRVGALVAKRFLDNPELGFRPVAFLDKEPLVDTGRRARHSGGRGELGSRRRDRAFQDRAGRDHVLDRAGRGAAADRSAL